MPCSAVSRSTVIGGALFLILALALLGASPARVPSLDILEEQPRDLDGDGFWDELVITGRIRDAFPRGLYWMHPHVVAPAIGLGDCSGPHALTRAQVVARRRGAATDDSTAGFARTNGLGQARVEWHFRGEELATLRGGPWQLTSAFERLDPWTRVPIAGQHHNFTHTLRASDWRKFGSASVYGESVRYSLEEDSTAARMDVRTWVHRADTLRFRAVAGDASARTDTTIRMVVGPGAHSTVLVLRSGARGRGGVARLDARQLVVRVYGLNFGWPVGDPWWLGDPEEFEYPPCGNE